MKNNKIDSIKNNPLFVMSLHSKELFHSNFWAWLFERNHEYVKIFFQSLVTTIVLKENKAIEI